MKNIAFIYSGDETGLQPLRSSRDAIVSILSSQLKWEKPINKRLASLEAFEKDLKVYKDEEIEDLLFYFMGHGTYMGAESSFYMKLIDEEKRSKKQNVQDIFNAIYDNFTLLPIRVSFIFDACFSGKVVFQMDKWDKSIEVLTSSLPNELSSAKSPDGENTLFTYHFCGAIERSNVHLDEISSYINEKVNSQESLYDATIGRDGKMKVAEITNSKKYLERIQNKLQNVIDVKSLRLYANNLLANYLNRVDLNTMGFNEIVEHLYDLRQPLLCLLHNLNSDILEKDFQGLKSEFIEFDTKNCSEYEEMQREELNLLLHFEIFDDDLSRTKVTFWKYQEPYAVDIKDIEVNLEGKNNPIDLVDAIFSLVGVSESNVLLEFILPYELIDMDITSWSDSFGVKLVKKYRIVRRVAERIERYRGNEGEQKSWKDFWYYYKNNKNKKLKKVQLPLEKEIRFVNFRKTPYIRFDKKFSIEEYTKLINTFASIVLSPRVDRDEELNQLCAFIEKKPLKKLVDKSFELFCDVPHVLIWDNPNRQIREKKEITGE